MKTVVSPIEPGEYRRLCGLVARLIPELTWRHSGLGLLQAYVQEGETDELRVHLWHPELRREGIEESGLLHDHRFDLRSHVLVGKLRQVEHELYENVDGMWQLHTVVHARAAAGGKHAPNDGLVSRLVGRYDTVLRETDITEGHAYTFPKRAFHGTYPYSGEPPELVITLVSKSAQDEEPARILAPVGHPVVHAFADPLPKWYWRELIPAAVAELEKRWRAR